MKAVGLIQSWGGLYMYVSITTLSVSQVLGWLYMSWSMAALGLILI
jgi:hypothetical protein